MAAPHHSSCRVVLHGVSQHMHSPHTESGSAYRCERAAGAGQRTGDLIYTASPLPAESSKEAEQGNALIKSSGHVGSASSPLL